MFSWLRLTAGLNFGLLFLYQTLAGVGQPFVYNAISKLAGAWFPKGEQTLANSIGTMGQLLGMITALVVAPIMVPDPTFSELQQNMLVFSVVVTASLILFTVLAKERRGGAEERARPWKSLLDEMKSVAKMRNISHDGSLLLGGGHIQRAHPVDREHPLDAWSGFARREAGGATLRPSGSSSYPICSADVRQAVAETNRSSVTGPPVEYAYGRVYAE